MSGIAEGEGDGLVLLHPIGLDHTFWEPVSSALGGHCRILRLDLRGHGRSGAPDSRPPIQTYAADIHETIGSFGLERPAVLGVSFGGMVAQTLALAYPDSVSRLLLCACPGGIPMAAQDQMCERGLAAERDGMAAIVPATLDRWFTAGFLHDPVVERVRQRLLTNDVRNWSDGWHAIADFNAFPHLGALRIPTLVVAGEFDKATSREASAALAAAIPGATLTVLPGAPHMLQIETGAQFATTVGDFLRS
ncbi:alpha/beta fold hydrolase [Mesorhizobium sp. B3-1-6]|uniref:alpha/beta fold hydrolase n=1 Tax=Mesorhizobium sp. B3-1-6 TaxID=2589895 RepID=UPI0015E3E130|nr:alpha/beta fold hydrolase [Mesorhizobium sp. B3-1-6]